MSAAQSEGVTSGACLRVAGSLAQLPNNAEKLELVAADVELLGESAPAPWKV